MMGWIKLNAFGTSDDVDAILRKGETNDNDYQLAVKDSTAYCTLDGDDHGGGGSQGATTLTAGNWYHIACVWDGTDIRVYLNGVLDNTPLARTTAIPTDTRPLYIGGRPTTDLVDGNIDDVRLYGAALSAGMIKAIAAGLH